MLQVDPISAKTLPFLDKLFIEGTSVELADKITGTPAAPLRRLTLAAIARITVPVGGPLPDNNSAKMLEELITLNMRNQEHLIPQVLDMVGRGEVMILTAAIIRYVMLEGDFAR